MSVFVFPGERDGLLEVEAIGEATLSNMREAHAELAERCRRAGLWHVLLDARKLEGSLSVFELYQLASYIEAIFRAAPFRMAILATPQGVDRFAETACRNRGIDVMIFEDVSAAEAWLRKRPPQKADSQAPQSLLPDPHEAMPKPRLSHDNAT